MQRSERTRPGRALAVLASAALLVTGLTASPAVADHDRGSNRGRHADRYFENGHPGRGRGHAKHHAHSGHHHRHRAYAVGYAEHSHRSHYRHDVRHAPSASFFCRGCRQHFGSRVQLERHVVHHHRVPPWRLGQVIVFSTLGWIFHG